MKWMTSRHRGEAHVTVHFWHLLFKLSLAHDLSINCTLPAQDIKSITTGALRRVKSTLLHIHMKPAIWHFHSVFGKMMCSIETTRCGGCLGNEEQFKESHTKRCPVNFGKPSDTCVRPSHCRRGVNTMNREYMVYKGYTDCRYTIGGENICS
ncbi:hypothetical protein V1515DRAFT_598945 [Lipomyces mesembrius]